jgi:hypothetical protein
MGWFSDYHERKEFFQGTEWTPIQQYKIQKRRIDMPSNNLKFNEELRELLEAKREEYGCVGRGEITPHLVSAWGWGEWAGGIVGDMIRLVKGSKAHILLLEYIRESLTPARRELLLYVKNNLDKEAWKILALTIPDEMKYNVPELEKEERGCLALIIKGLENKDRYCNDTASKCDRLCHRIFEGSSEFDKCPYSNEGSSKSEALPILKEVLKAQKPLLPPHNVVQLEKAEYEAWGKWANCKTPEHSCPHFLVWNRVQQPQDCLKMCDPIFHDRGGRCPCKKYGSEAVLAIIDKILALGPKEELRLCPYNCNAPCPHDFKEYSCVGCSHKGVLQRKKEAFKPYVAVRIKGCRGGAKSHLRGALVQIVGCSSIPNTVTDSCGEDHSLDNILPITDPADALVKLHDLSGEEGSPR